MLTLAIETSTSLGGVALGRGASIIAESTLAVRANHSETVLDEVARLLDRSGSSPADVERIVVGAGPGSFTGVRIAASLAKGWCHARGTPLYEYSSLRAVAVSAGAERVCAMFDARRDEVYAAAYDGHGVGATALEPCALSIDDVLARLEPADAWTFAGEGATKHREAIEARGATVAPAFLGVPRASGLLWLAEHLPQGRVDDPAAWEPRYVRASGAEREAARHG